jgi:hypothetical protein
MAVDDRDLFATAFTFCLGWRVLWQALIRVRPALDRLFDPDRLISQVTGWYS